MTERRLDLTGWRTLNHIASLENRSMDELCDLIDAERGDTPFHQAQQIFTIAYYRASLEARLNFRDDHDLSASDEHHPLQTPPDK